MTVVRRLAYAVAGFVVFSCLAGLFLAEVVVHPGRRELQPGDMEDAKKLLLPVSATLTEVSVTAVDGSQLAAWNLLPKASNGMAVLLLHGVSDSRMGMMRYAEMFLRHGYEVLMPDARAHGASGGAIATYGLKEAEDIHRWVDWLGEHQHPPCVFALGESMGAAELLESLRVETQFCAVVAESPFASFREVGYDRMGQFFRTGAWLGRTLLRPVLEAAFLRARWKYGLDMEQASPIRVVEATRTPVLLIHGVVDRNIPARHSRQIAAKNRAVVLWEVPGADHGGAISVAPAEFEPRVVAWLEIHSR